MLVTDFYGAAAAGAWQLSESVNYLQITLMHHQIVWHHQALTQSAALMNVRGCIKKMVAETAVIYPHHIYILLLHSTYYRYINYHHQYHYYNKTTNYIYINYLIYIHYYIVHTTDTSPTA